MPTLPTRSLLLLITVLPLAGATCAPLDGSPPPAPDRNEQPTAHQSALTGTVSYGTDCTVDHINFLNKTMMYGRVAASSNAFRSCMNSIGTGVPNVIERYMQCKGDPAYGQPLATQISTVLARTAIANPLKMNCTGGAADGGNASALIGDYNQKTEEFSWGPWLSNMNNRNASDPAWPFSQAAAIAWHEVMHQYHYGHGTNGPNDTAKAACGYASTVAFNFQTNTMPYIVQGCMQSVLSQSGQRCGDMASCGAGKLKLLTALNGTTCECVADPRAGTKLYFADVNGDKKADAIIVPKNAPIAVRLSTGTGFATEKNWTTNPSFGSRGTFFADATGDGRADAIFVNDDGIRVRPSDGTFFTGNSLWTNVPSWGSRGTFFADATGDGRADAIFVNDDGIRVRPSSGTFFTGNSLWTNVPSWGSRGTFFVDATGDRRADAIFVNDDGIRVRPSDGTFFTGNALWTNQPSWGSQKTAFADVTGEGRADAIFANSNWVTVRPSDGTFFTGNARWTSGPLLP